MFSVEFSDRALKALKKLDKFTATVITAWIRKNLEGLTPCGGLTVYRVFA